jgi:hypothetical protein
VSNLQSIVLTLSISYAVIGALLLVVLVYARLPWPVKVVAVIVTSAFYVVSFNATRGLLGWASQDRLPTAFKLLQTRIARLSASLQRQARRKGPCRRQRDRRRAAAGRARRRFRRR